MKIRTIVLAAIIIPWAALLAVGQEKRTGEAKPTPDLRDEAREKALQESLSDFGFVSIVKKDATIVEVVDELKRKATWLNIDLDIKDIRPDERISIDLKEPVPFKTALDFIVKKAGLIVEEESPVLIRLSKPPTVSVKFEDAPVKNAIDIITQVSGKNVIVSPRVSGTVTLNVKNVPWIELLDNVVKTVGCTVVKEKGNILRIVREEELRAQLDTKVYTLKYIQPPPAYKARISTAYAVGTTRSPGDPINDFTLLKILRSALSKDAAGSAIGRLEYDFDTNSVTITDTKPALDKVETILALLDIEPDQVLIEVTFVSTSNEDLLNFGTNYTFNVTGEGGFGVASSPSGTTKTTKLPFGFGRDNSDANAQQYFLNDFSVTAIFRAFKKDKFTKIMQRPTIPVLNNNEATIFVGETIHYAESFTTTDVGGATIKSVREAGKSPVNVGFQLLVIPHVVKGMNSVILTIIPTNNFLIGSSTSPVKGFNRFTVGADTIDLPHYSQTTVVTKIMLESGKTAILGGLSVERTTFEDKKIPFFGDIPILNIAFKDSSESTTKDNLLIFVTPRVVRGGKTTADNLDAVIQARKTADRGKLDELKKEEFEKDVQKALDKRSKDVEKELQNIKSEK